MKMKTRLGTLWKASLPAAVAVMALLLAGCFGKSGSESSRLAFAEMVAREAAYVGAGIDLEKHPAHRAAYAAALAGVRTLVDGGNYDPIAFQKSLAALPALRGGNGALVIEGGVALWSVVSGWIDLEDQPVLRSVMLGTIYGLEQALARPTTPAGLRAQVTWPKQCVPPARKK